MHNKFKNTLTSFKKEKKESTNQATVLKKFNKTFDSRNEAYFKVSSLCRAGLILSRAGLIFHSSVPSESCGSCSKE